MSGVFCGGCGEGNLRPDPAGAGRRPVRCDLCEWTADEDALPREWPEEDLPWTKRERKAAGRLFFLWVDLEPGNDAAVSALMKALRLTSMSVAPRVLLELEEKPSDDLLRSLAALRGIRGLRLVP
ncbi:MAG TPA: hypothetical protein VF950_25670 [Planctomycetota bacterium]